ncbi:MAG: sigma-70 family RNA polymerase sigma factor [Planctomycetes bacterium]|nr:sigma-70 family RNA polymerase sigma factor [Planctomycetota bacterium]
MDETDRAPTGGTLDAELTRSIELVERAQSGDLEAYNRLFERYYERVLRIVKIRLGPRARSYVEAEDIVQETFIAAVRTFERFEMRSESSLINWMAKLAEHKIKESVDYFHAQKRDRRRERAFVYVRNAMDSGSLHFDPPADIDIPLDAVEKSELKLIIEECLSELSETHREVILLRLYAKGSWDWIAEQIGRPTEGAARELFRRAKIALVNRVSQKMEMGD